MSGAYYNEFDPQAAAWLRELIKQGLIADGEVDERDLWDVPACDLARFTQVHLCAGIGVWSYALRLAGWPDERPVWTGSFPCQPFSAAGKGNGFDDERHLWPAGYWLIEQCQPPVVFGEQVASKAAGPWLDLVQADLEALAYSVGAVPFPSAGVGAPHIRDRLYWVADAQGSGRADGPQVSGSRRPFSGKAEPFFGVGHRGAPGGLANPSSERRRLGQPRREDASDASFAIEAGRLADAHGRQRDGLAEFRGTERDRPDTGWTEGRGEPRSRSVIDPAGPTNGLWRDADWLFCRDGKWRPVEPGTFPLAHGAPARVGRLRGYGNAINAEAARVFIEAYLDGKTIVIEAAARRHPRDGAAIRGATEALR